MAGGDVVSGGRVGVLGRTIAALKAFRLTWDGWGGGYGAGRGWSSLQGLLPGARVDWEELAGDVTLNSAVAICLGWIADNIGEPRLVALRAVADGETERRREGEREGRSEGETERWSDRGTGGWRDGATERGREGETERRSGNEEPVPGHPLVELIENPNPYYDGDALLAATAMSYGAHGNAYWLKVRNGLGRVTELYHAPYWEMEPRSDDPHRLITHYVRTAGGVRERWDPKDVVHFRYGVDPENPRQGVSRLRPVLREIATDNQVSNFLAALLRNMGIPTVLITPAEGEATINEEKAALLQREFMERYGGENAGKPMVPNIRVKVEKLSLAPAEMGLENFRRAPEARICGALRIPALVVGLNVGDLTRTYANYGQARKAAYEDCLMPMGRRLAKAASRSLMHEVESQEGDRLGWDYSQVAALREDLMNVYRRNNLGVLGGWMKVNEARAKAGLPEDPEGDVYLRREAHRGDPEPAALSGAGAEDAERVPLDRMNGMGGVGLRGR